MLQIIIFSFNRAIQLETLIRSLDRFCINTNYVVDVIYNTTSHEYQQSYDRLADLKDRKNVHFHKEAAYDSRYSINELLCIYNLRRLIKYPYIRKPKTDFRHRMINVLKRNDAKEVMFLTDDSVFIKPFTIGIDISSWIETTPAKNQFSLRIGLGMNCEPIGIVEKMPEKIIQWDYNKAPKDTNWGYHFSVDGHIYSKKYIIDLFSRYLFVNPNTLEGYICAMARRKGLFNMGRAFEEVVMLSFPINMVQAVVNNESLGVSVEMLNNYCLMGYKLEYPIPSQFKTFQQYPDHIILSNNNEDIKLRIK